MVRNLSSLKLSVQTCCIALAACSTEAAQSSLTETPASASGSTTGTAVTGEPGTTDAGPTTTGAGSSTTSIGETTGGVSATEATGGTTGLPGSSSGGLSTTGDVSSSSGPDDTTSGTTGPVPPADSDGDGVPDPSDPFPDDPDQPGVGQANVVYAHSAGTLHTVDVETFAVTDIGPFVIQEGDGCTHAMTDLAVDRWGVVYGVTEDCGYVINPQTAEAFKLAALPGPFNALTMVPAGVVDPMSDSLIAIGNGGEWIHLVLNNGVFDLVPLGNYGPGYTSAGDAFSIEGVGTFAAVLINGVPDATVIVSVDPATGAVQEELATLQGYPAIYGLAGWDGLILAFDESGAIVKVDPVTKAVTPLGNKGVSWWGAGVTTLLPQ